ncbi:MAG TPA: flagellar basal-body rod protein FlgF [Bryobacteraceae bacterium]|jgi:flagellar basal-body rod protein FlgF|nr:flagellar basal-body rod protein FlgF [Bryobacteraceae bacterium]
MDPLTGAAASGMRASMESLDMLANNLANAQTNGYKSDREFYDLYTSPDATEGPVEMPNIVKNWTDFSQGSLQQTSNSLDFGISGQGFFSVNGPNGTLYTRNGSFKLNAAGQLATQDGYTVRGTDGKPVQMDPAQAVNVGSDGVVMQSGNQVGQIQLAAFQNPSDLVKQGTNNFQFTGRPNEMKTAAGEIQQGKLESSNVAPADSAVRLVGVMRQFEMLQKAISIGTDMNKQAIEEVARSGN